MTLNTVAKHYASLTPEERFRLILAAGARGDDAEQERLSSAGRRIALSVNDHTPFALSFNELDHLVYADLLAAAADYLEAIGLTTDTGPPDDGEDTPEDGDRYEDEGDLKGDDGWDETRDWNFDLALALGFILKVKCDGWKLFCERLNVPPFVMWTFLPGYDRLERALKLAGEAAFVPEGMLRFLNSRRSKRKPELPQLTTVPITADAIAAGHDRLFRERARWWGGE
jgi:hypothetical protein